jgi:hypothetical protein
MKSLKNYDHHAVELFYNGRSEHIHFPPFLSHFVTFCIIQSSDLIEYFPSKSIQVSRQRGRDPIPLKICQNFLSSFFFLPLSQLKNHSISNTS